MMNLDPCSVSNHSSNLEMVAVALKERFYGDTIPMPSIKIGIVHKNNHVRFSPNVIRTGKYLADEIEIDGSISNDIQKVCECVLDGFTRSYAFHNGIKISSRGATGRQQDDFNGYYLNKEYKRIAETHGLKVERLGPTKGFATCGVTPAVTEMIESGHWMLPHERDRYTYGDVTKSGHNRKYVCPACGASFWATRKHDWICAGCNEHVVCAS